MTETTTDELRERVAEAEARNAGRAAQLVPVAATEEAAVSDKATAKSVADQTGHLFTDTTNKVAAFAREHPVLAVTGGLVAGLAIASMFKAPRKLAAKGGTKAAGLATVGAEMALAYALDAYEKAQQAGKEGARKLDDLTDSVGDSTRKARREAAFRVGEAGDTARITARDAKKALARKFGRG